MTAPVFVTDPGLLTGYDHGDLFLLHGAEGRHAGVVQRRAVGEQIDVVDGAGVRLVGDIESVGPEGVQLRVRRRVEEPTTWPHLVLVQALAKGDRDEMAIEAATEVGVDTVIPWQAERSIVIWRGDRAAKSRARWLATVRAAAKQSRRAWVPQVEQAVDRKALVARTEQVVAAGGAVLVLHEEAMLPLSAARAELPAEGTEAEVLVVVGPEGGISDQETAALVAAGARTVRLGPHVLRTSTAGTVALSLLAAGLGRWD
ncbi:16S rRNA (uracil(1498)-N(3))-methyltransferase [Cellulomonas denverensis]|uniref:Ribosomal RNA small subunit methyltransferase E n=1 Tax=Cellulomonas denverensis TaxID=264297 RepID=A0A7X6KWS3_9CELL|nr:16S rRNA (uracil(1498)-N(3))-methyltransferase [Cellulomonas denverensis]NKY23687.1 16S rRNA (uracil(1498)-N(3))-methyltransferase [Cellulomonas denverensis]GIG26971.1 ribosomal RNA small subunit methyltransferase E [Cellulomonas denverensis]